MAMPVAINTPWVARNLIPHMQREIDRFTGDATRYHIFRVSFYATILSHDSVNLCPVYSALDATSIFDHLIAKQEPLEWQADPDDDWGDAAVFHHLQQQAATIPLLSSVILQNDRGNAAATLTGNALSASINTRTQGRPLSSFHRYSFRLSDFELGVPLPGLGGGSRTTDLRKLFLDLLRDLRTGCLFHQLWSSSDFLVWASPRQRDNRLKLLQVQVDVVDLCSRRLPTSRPPKRRRTACNQFLQVSHSPGLEHRSRGNPPPHAKRFNGVRYRPDRKVWVAEMKPHKHKTKQDFGNFKSEDEAARAVDAAFHHYGRPDLLNFPHTSPQFLSTRPTAPAGLDEKTKVRFVRKEAKLLLAAISASSSLHSAHTTSFPIPDLSASPRSCPSSPFRSLSEISSPFNCTGPDEVDDAVSLDPISTIGALPNLETLNSLQNGEQRWDLAEDSCALAEPPNVVNPSAYESPNMWLESIIRSSPAPTFSRSPSPSHFQEEIAYALLEHQSI